MTASFCFKDRKLELFHEASIRGWLAGVLDFPRLKTQEECIAAAQSVPAEMKPEVCCIDNEAAYHLLITSAWCSFYLAHCEHGSEREIVVEASVLKKMAPDEALRFLRNAFADDGARAEVDRAYSRFIELSRERRSAIMQP